MEIQKIVNIYTANRQPESKQQLGHVFGNDQVQTEFRHFVLVSYFGMSIKI